MLEALVVEVLVVEVLVNVVVFVLVVVLFIINGESVVWLAATVTLVTFSVMTP